MSRDLSLDVLHALLSAEHRSLTNGRGAIVTALGVAHVLRRTTLLQHVDQIADELAMFADVVPPLLRLATRPGTWTLTPEGRGAAHRVSTDLPGLLKGAGTHA